MREHAELIGMVAGMVFVAVRLAGKRLWTLIPTVGASGAMGYAMGPEFAAVIGWLGPATAAGAVTVLSFAVLDTAVSLIADREAIRELVGKWAGGAK